MTTAPSPIVKAKISLSLPPCIVTQKYDAVEGSLVVIPSPGTDESTRSNLLYFRVDETPAVLFAGTFVEHRPGRTFEALPNTAAVLMSPRGTPSLFVSSTLVHLEV